MEYIRTHFIEKADIERVLESLNLKRLDDYWGTERLKALGYNAALADLKARLLSATNN